MGHSVETPPELLGWLPPTCVLTGSKTDVIYGQVTLRVTPPEVLVPSLPMLVMAFSPIPILTERPTKIVDRLRIPIPFERSALMRFQRHRKISIRITSLTLIYVVIGLLYSIGALSMEDNKLPMIIWAIGSAVAIPVTVAHRLCCLRFVKGRTHWSTEDVEHFIPNKAAAEEFEAFVEEFKETGIIPGHVDLTQSDPS